MSARLYRAVGEAMAAYSRLRFSLRVEGDVALAPGTLYVVTHRSYVDPVLVCAAIYPRVRGAGDDDLPWFVVRDDLLLPGFFAHLAPGRVPLRLGIGRILERHLRCLPLRPANRMRIVELARFDPRLPLDDLPDARAFRARAHTVGRPVPRHAGDVLASVYADLLWRLVERDEAPEPAGAWRARLSRSRSDLERAIALLRRGSSLLLFPEGTPSRDGAVGPVQRGTGLLVRRGRPRRVVPVGLAYDTAARRPAARVRLGAPAAPPAGDVEEEILALLRATMPRVRTASTAGGSDYDRAHGNV